MKLLSASILAFVFAISNAYASTADADKTLESIVEVDGFTKDNIYSATKTWLAETFVSSKTVIELDDKQAGKIVGNVSVGIICNGGFWACAGLSGRYLNASMRVDIKDNKFRITLSKMTWSSPGTATSPAYNEVEFYSNDKVDEMMPTLQSLSDGLKKAVMNEKKNSEW